MFNRDRLRCNIARNSQTIFRLSTVDEPIAESIDRLTHLYMPALRPHRFDHTREFVTQDNRKRSFVAFRRMGCGIPVELRWCDRCGTDLDTHPVSYRHLRAHETGRNLVCRLLLEKKK